MLQQVDGDTCSSTSCIKPTLPILQHLLFLSHRQYKICTVHSHSDITY